MGISDPIVFPVFRRFIGSSMWWLPRPRHRCRVGFFGFPEKNEICRYVERRYGVEGELFDVQLGNWDINGDPWPRGKFDVIFCFRTACFAKDPARLLHSFHEILNDAGRLFIDWSLGSIHFPRDGDDWTFGWEFRGRRCYGDYGGTRHFLHSNFWDDTILDSRAGRLLVEHAARQDHYQGVPDWRKQVRSEYGAGELAGLELIERWFRIRKMHFFNTAERGGRPGLYSLFSLRKTPETAP
ncbi:MAG: methyltransferase domain-containing protein [Candidatus Hydrogenedentota bacterium]